ncbi:MAG TPA: D-alanyl-D-alanine carboxypeptidase family protein [Candidatus Binatia bacterium]|nr:D-alanyl-D-alanine carboxypeptidase family protein [Candidatus Binatia bacterium]
METREAGRRTTGRWAMLFAALALAAAAAPARAGEPPRLAARAGLVMDAQTGQVLWEQNGDVPLPPASTTKVLTSLMALESGRLDDQLVVSLNAQLQPPSKLDLRAGQRVRLMDLVYALMLKSANDAAVVVAEGLGGSVESFAERMNQRARELGATSSHFRNPNGLPDDAHVSSAHDLALILRHALTVPGFRGIAATRMTEIPIIARANVVRMVAVHSHNRLLGSYVVPVVGKTGYTRAAGRCFVGAASLDGREVIIAVLGSSNVWGDSRKLIAYGLGAVAPDAASGVQFATADAPARKRAAVRSGKPSHAKKPAAVAKSKRKPSKAEASAKRSSTRSPRESAYRASAASGYASAPRRRSTDPR